MCSYSEKGKATSRDATVDAKLVLNHLAHAKGFKFESGPNAGCVACLPTGARLLMKRKDKVTQATFRETNEHSARKDWLHFDREPNPVNVQDLDINLRATVISLSSAPAVRNAENDAAVGKARDLVNA